LYGYVLAHADRLVRRSVVVYKGAALAPLVND
jgi:hypothetical protein